MSAAGAKIIEGLKDAVAGNFSAVTIEGQRWVRAPEWLPIETAPLPPFDKEHWYKDAFRCLGARPGYFMGEVSYGYTERGKGRWRDARSYVCTPVFWMLLPEPPVSV